jgi:hypothetical protein
MTEQWDFVLAAYFVTALGTLCLLLFSWRAMRSAEKRAASVGRGEGE